MEASLLLLLADLYQRQGRETELLALLQELEIGNYAEDLKLEAFYRHFKLDLKNGRQAAAREDCLSLLEKFPLSKYECDCRLFLARTAFAGGDFKAAAATLESMAPGGCPDPDLQRQVILLKARSYQQTGRLAEARKLYLTVAEMPQSTNQQTAIAFTGLGDIFLLEKKFDEAVFFYDKARQNPVKDLAAGAALKHAAALEAAGRIKAAQKSYIRITYLYPGQNHIVGDALLAVLRLARRGKDKSTANKIIEKLKAIKLDKVQLRKFEKMKTL
jgi:tetratricopeptide (TPR) repeat protein